MDRDEAAAAWFPEGEPIAIAIAPASHEALARGLDTGGAAAVELIGGDLASLDVHPLGRGWVIRGRALSDRAQEVRLRTAGRLVPGVTHDLNNAFSVMMSNLRFVLHLIDAGTVSLPRATSALEDALTSAGHASVLVQGIQRLAHGRQLPVTIVEAIERVETIGAYELREHPLEIAFDEPPDARLDSRIVLVLAVLVLPRRGALRTEPAGRRAPSPVRLEVQGSSGNLAVQISHSAVHPVHRDEVAVVTDLVEGILGGRLQIGEIAGCTQVRIEIPVR